MRPDFDSLRDYRRHSGFTLVEAVMAIAITGVIAAIVTVFIRTPVQGYLDSAQRAALTDTADTAIRRMVRDLHLALPNSVRISGSAAPGNTLALEFLSTRDGGRYRAERNPDGSGDILAFDQNDTTFDILGPPITLRVRDQIVIYNLGQGITGADAYVTGGNRRAYSGTGGTVTNVPITSTTPFPLESPGRRFQVVDSPVSYVCDLSAGTLRRYSGYAISATQLNPPGGSGLVNALLAQNVTACAFDYVPGVTQRSGFVSIRVALTANGETVSLYQGVHVSNVP